jgi:AcrR family transcriptional regulator
MPVQKITREEILEKSLLIFRRQGYHRTTMQDLADACGVLKGSFYYHFDSKEALMKELLQNIGRYLDKKVYTIAYDEALLPKERLDKLMLKLGKQLLSQEGGCIVGNTTLETLGLVPEFEPILKQIFDGWIKALEHIYATQKSPEAALRLARQTVAELEGAVMLSRLYPDSDLLRDAYLRALVRLG